MTTIKSIAAIAAVCCLAGLAGCGGNTNGRPDTAPVVISPPPVVSQPDPPPPPPAPIPPPPPPPTVVFMGDSITAGWPLSDYLANAIDAGISGQTSSQMLARFQTDVLARNPSIVVILAGTNDVLKTQNPNVNSIQQMADMAAHAGVKVIIGEIPPNSNWSSSSFVINDPVQGSAAITTFNTQLVAMAHASGYGVTDYYDVMVLPDGSQKTALFLDGTHPDKAGYDEMWSVLAPLLKADNVSAQ